MPAAIDDTAWVTEAKLAPLAVTEGKLAAASVATAKLQDSSVSYVKHDAETRELIQAIANLAINPSYDVVIPGTHTEAMTKLSTGSAVRNIQFPGWQVVACSEAGVPLNIQVSNDTAVLSPSGSGRSLQLAILASGAGTVKLRQVLGSTVAGVNQDTLREVEKLRGRYLNIACDAKMQNADVDTHRLYIYTNGTGGTTTYGSYNAVDTNWQRMTVAAHIPADATEIHFGWEIASGPEIYWFDNMMAKAADRTVSASALAFQPAQRQNIVGGNLDGGSWQFLSSTGIGDYRVLTSAGWSTMFDINANRPAWANAIDVLVMIYGTGAGQTFYIKPNGATNVYNQLTTYVAGQYITGLFRIPLGADAQLSVYLPVNAVMYGKVVRWIGEGL